MTEREQFEQQLREQEDNLVKILTKSGITEVEAKEMARQQTESMGATKTMRGECPLGGANPMACMFCHFGHMTECHYPATCEEAKCSHYQQVINDEFI